MKPIYTLCALVLLLFSSSVSQAQQTPQIIAAFAEQGVALREQDVESIRALVEVALQAKCQTAVSNSQTKFSAVEVAQQLKLNPDRDRSIVPRITKAIESLPCRKDACEGAYCRPYPEPPHHQYLNWDAYFRQTIDLNTNQQFLNLVSRKGFHPVKISWEDISRYQGSVWGNRISDVGIWVRKNESESSSAELALSVRRDSNYRDKVLMVPIEAIKIHLHSEGRTVEVTLQDRLRSLGLESKTKDRHVIVSNQFAIVPVPSSSPLQEPIPGIDYPTSPRGPMIEPVPGVLPPRPYPNHPPRAAFNFSIFPYGSTNFVITDVIEGSSEAIVGPGTHQLLYADVLGQKAPFTASRADDRPDLLALEKDLKGQGMDVDVQRYYLIQIPLRSNVPALMLSNMGTPPSLQGFAYGGAMDGVVQSAPMPKESGGVEVMLERRKGVEKVAIGHGESEGPYNRGSGYRGAREEAPIRVTVVYFVTPRGEITEEDMNTFAEAFEAWDSKAIWGGSFVVPD